MRTLLAFVLGLSGLVAGAATVSSQLVRQNWPWSGTVSVSYILEAEFGEAWDMALTVTDASGNDVTGVTSAQSGDTMDVTAGEHELVWDPVAAGVAIDKQTMLKFTLTPKKPLGKRYLVIDLSAGIGGNYPVTQMDDPPTGGFNTTEYKTEKLVFRRCPAGSYVMGSPETEEGREHSGWKETPHKVTLTKDFYIGVFEFTRGQSARLWTTNTACDVSSTAVLNTVKRGWAYRGSDGNWPITSAVEEGSLVGRLRAGVTAGLPEGYVIDLPTEAQWEYACRAGTTTAWNNGADPDYHEVYSTGNYVKDSSGKLIAKDEVLPGKYGDYALDKLGQYSCKTKNVVEEWTKIYYWAQDTPPGTVGRFLPNAWGLYDMHGNDSEICVDQYTESGNKDLKSAEQTDPWFAVKPSNTGVIVRGGGWLSDARDCRSAARNYYYLPTANGDQSYGIRLAIVPEKK